MKDFIWAQFLNFALSRSKQFFRGLDEDLENLLQSSLMHLHQRIDDITIDHPSPSSSFRNAIMV